MSPSSITSLPPEIVGLCFSYMEKDDITSLRLVNKHTGAIATREFAIRYFTGISIMMSRYSLETSVEICAHPVFASYVRKIRLSAVRASGLHLGSLSDELYSHIDSGTIDDMEDARNALQYYINECCEQRSLEVGGEGTRLITKAMTLLKKYGKPLHFKVNNYSDPGIKPIGESKAFVQRGHQYLDAWIDHMDASLRMLLAAVAHSGCIFDALTITNDRLGADATDMDCILVRE